MYGCSVPAGVVGGDLFKYINFQQRYNIEARTERACRLSRQAVEGRWPEDWIEWLRARPDYQPAAETAFRRAASLQQVRIAENLRDLSRTAGVLLVDAQGHGIISAKIASTVRDTFHALMLSELDHHGKTTPELFEQINIRLAHSVTARNALGSTELGETREIATMLYGEIGSTGHFRFVNFGHPPPLIFRPIAACSRKWIEREWYSFRRSGWRCRRTTPTGIATLPPAFGSERRGSFR